MSFADGVGFSECESGSDIMINTANIMTASRTLKLSLGICDATYEPINAPGRVHNPRVKLRRKFLNPLRAKAAMAAMF